MRVDLDAEGVAAESLPRFQQAPRQLRQLWRWAAASVALAAACAVLGFFIGLFAADSLWPPLLYNLGAAWLVLFAGLHAAYRVAAWRCVVLGAEASARPAWLRWQRDEPDATADSAYERLLERLGQAIAHGLTQLGHAALWLAASAALALCLVAAGWRLDLPPASSGQAADLAIGICLLLAFAVLVLERRFASQGPAQWPEAPVLGQLARALIGTLVLAALCLFLARQGHPWAPRLAVLLGLLPAALALELLGRAILAMFAPQRAGLEPRLVATSLLADLLRWPPRPLQRLQHELHQRFGIDLRQVWAFGFMRRAFLPVLAVVSLSGWLLSGVREIGMDARGVYERFGKPVAVLGPGLHLGLPWPLGRVLAVENGVVHELATSVAAGDGGAEPLAPAEGPAPDSANRLWDASHVSEKSQVIASLADRRQSFQIVNMDVRIVYRIALDDASALAATYRSADVPTLVLFAVAAACLVQVRSGEAMVITRFGNPARVLLEPGLAWRLPLPFESAIPVDLRLRTTSSGLQDVGTRDGLRIIVQAYVAWQVQGDADNVQRFMRAVRNQPDEAARQLRTFVGSALETTASAYDLADLVNTEASRVRIGDFEARLREQIDHQLLATYGVKVVQVGIERLTLPKVTLGATVDRMRAERETIATERTAEGRRQAAEIRSAAERDARVIQAEASVKAAEIEAQARVEAARIYGKAYAGSPQLYNLLRSLDTLGTIVNGDTRLVLRTDAAPFRVLVDGPPALPAEAPANGRRP